MALIILTFFIVSVNVVEALTIQKLDPSITKSLEEPFKSDGENISDEQFCHQITWSSEQGCQSSRCEALISCPACLNMQIPSCHTKGFHKLIGSKYDPPLEVSVVRKESAERKMVISEPEIKKIIEAKSTDQNTFPTTTNIGKIEIVQNEKNDVYKVMVEKESKLLGVISVKSKLNYEVSSTSGKILSEKKPWYLNIAPFLFNWR